MESVNVNTPSVTIEERKRKTREAVKQAQNNERDQYLKDLVNENLIWRRKSREFVNCAL